MDMKHIPKVFQSIDLLWSEGAAYNIGFGNALRTWAPALTRGGFAVLSELSWLKERAPEPTREFFRSGYPDMLAPRAQALLEHRDAPVRAFASETLKEIEAFESSEESYGYAFYVLQRA